jgi:hypothetical protein
MSAKQVTPDRIISAQPRLVPSRTKSWLTKARSTGITYPINQTSSRRSSASPRSSVIGTCVCALTSPGITTRPWQSTVSAAMNVCASGPTATIESPRTATALPRWMVNSGSIVRTTALVNSRSHVRAVTLGL